MGQSAKTAKAKSRIRLPEVRARAFDRKTDSTAKIENLLSRAQQARFRDIATVLDYRRSGATLFSAGADGVIRAIDADSDQIRVEFNASDDWIYALAVSPDGKSLVSGDWAGNIKLWKLDDAGAKPAW